MTTVTFKGQEIELQGTFPTQGKLPTLKLVKSDLTELNTNDLQGKKVVLNIFPSVDTGVCALQLKQFSNQLKDKEDITLVSVSLDLPFALKRFCATENINNAITTSDFRYKNLDSIGVKMLSGPLTGLLARAVIVTDTDLNIVYSELVSEITTEPNYQEALKHL